MPQEIKEIKDLSDNIDVNNDEIRKAQEVLNDPTKKQQAIDYLTQNTDQIRDCVWENLIAMVKLETEWDNAQWPNPYAGAWELYNQLFNTTSEQLQHQEQQNSTTLENQETAPNNMKTELNKNAGPINKLLSLNGRENMTLGDVYEQTEKALTQSLKDSILRELLKDKYLTDLNNNGVREFNEVGKQVVEQVNKCFTQERMNNVTFWLLNTIITKIDASVAKAGGNKELELSHKTTILLGLQNMIKNGGLSDLSKLPPEVVSGLDVSWDAIKWLQTNFNAFIKAKLKEGGLDTTSRETRRQSIIDGSDFSWIGLWLSENKQNKSILKVVPTAFEHAFSYFDNQQTVTALMNGLTAITADKPFDAWAIQKVEGKTQPTEEQISSFVTMMNWLAIDMPTDPAQQQLLKEKVIAWKFDKLLDKLGFLKDIVLGAIDWLSKSPLGLSLISFLGKAFGMKEWEIKNLIDRPYIKFWVDTYLATIRNTELMSKPPYEWNNMKLETNGTKWDIKTEYYKNRAWVVMVKEGDHYTCKKIDAAGKLIALDKTTDKALYDLYIEEKDGIAVAKLDKNTFIGQDLNTVALKEILVNVYKQKTWKNINGYIDQWLLRDTVWLGDTIFADLLKNNPYIYSTEDLVGSMIHQSLPAIDAKVAEIEKTNTPTQQPPQTPPQNPDQNATAQKPQAGNAAPNNRQSAPQQPNTNKTT